MNDRAALRAPTFGPETWQEIAGQQWSMGDWWLCVIAITDHGGDLNTTRSWRPAKARPGVDLQLGLS
ncbi:MAG: hypothetical protein ABIP03_02770 [Aquihabitans sp.]